ncbi:MAG: methylmalonyl-CoA mutase family protein [Gammaproteobacteria bacterium]|nr:MAG: methylmalonyl-CoA mutase family protein [Gammaproteobacteria bacterium]
MSTAANDARLPGRDRSESTLRFITAASLFDGHDAAINIVRRLLQSNGAEVVHLGHNRSVADIVRAALQEDADAIACSSYQGGHNEYFRYMVDMLRQAGAEHVRIVVGGGGTIAPDEIESLEAYGVEKIYDADEGLALGLQGMAEDIFRRVRSWPRPEFDTDPADPADPRGIGQTLSLLEEAVDSPERIEPLRRRWSETDRQIPVIGMTGTGGAGKSSLVDELLNRVLRCFPDRRIAVLAVDPTRRRSGGALLGDRIRMNSLSDDRIFMRSMATRRQHLATSAVLTDSIAFLKHAGYDLILVETAGIGQSDTEIVDLVDVSLYVMTSEYGAASQLEKIDMLDYADLVALNKFEKRGSEDALRDVRKQWKRNRHAFQMPDDEVPVYPTIASQFNDPGVNELFLAICDAISAMSPELSEAWTPQEAPPQPGEARLALIPPQRVRYLAEIAEDGRHAAREAQDQAGIAARAHACYQALEQIGDEIPEPLTGYRAEALEEGDVTLRKLRRGYNDALAALTPEIVSLLRSWPDLRASVEDENYSYRVRDREITGSNYTTSLSHLSVPKIAAPRFRDWGELLDFLLRENLPGHYPYTAGVYPYRREREDPIRMFAGEGTAERTNRRFHYLSAGHEATRLSTAFDSVTLYGEDPDRRPDIYGRIGNSGVSIASLDDMKRLYSGFDLCCPATSVSMTINGPAPIILAMFLNAAIDQQVEKHLKDSGGWDAAQSRIAEIIGDRPHPRYRGDLPEGHDGSGLGLLGVSGDRLLDAETYGRIREQALSMVRGTVQADILKEDQAQNTCIFSTEFALRMMGDVQDFFIDHGVRNFYSVSISGYHIAEAGANPISQLAFTLANGLTLVEYYLSRGMQIDDFAPNLSFFFSNGMDPEYVVIGRVARRIWARAMRRRYGAGPRSQMLKYHIQTSGRSLHAQEIQFNDVRTTLQALYALLDSCNSLHTNSYDEAITTPTEESVRRAVAIQMIINKELGLNRNQNPWQGSYLIDYLTDAVEEAVYQEFERISDRGGVLGAMETMYQRGKIQEESLYYESRKHDGTLPIVGVNTFKPPAVQQQEAVVAELIRSTEAEKISQVEEISAFQTTHEDRSKQALQQLGEVAARQGNVFAELMEAVKVCSLGQITHALYEVGGQYRRNM